MSIITWRNIETDTTRGAAGLMEVARRAFNDGMGNFNGVIEDKNKVNQENWDVQKKNNTSSFLDRLAQYKTPEELAAAQASGELDALKQQFGGQVDADAIRGAEAKQGDVLMQRIAAQNQYGDDKVDRDARPLRAEFQGLLAQGKTKEAAQFLSDRQLGLDESGDLRDLQALEKTQFSQGMQKSNLGISQANLALSQDRNARDSKDWNDQWDQTTKKRLAVNLANDALAGKPDLASARSSYIELGRSSGLSEEQIDFGLKNLQQTYQLRTGLTPEQDALISGDTDVIQATKDAQSSADALKRSRYSDVKNFQMTESDAINSVFKRVPGEEDNTATDVQDQLEIFKQQNPSAKDVNLGPVVDQALKAMGVNEEWLTDNKLNLTEFNNQLASAYKEFNQYDKDKSEVEKAASKAATLRLKKQLELTRGNITSNLK